LRHGEHLAHLRLHAAEVLRAGGFHRFQSSPARKSSLTASRVHPGT
jgi:hypothetical protein